MLMLGLAFLAGVLSILSPCVLPILPLVLGPAVSEHRHGPAALAAGLAVSFVTIGLFVATIGFSIGLDTGLFRTLGAVLMVGFGAILMVPALQARVAMAGTPIANWSEQTFGGKVRTGGLGGQFSVGLLLGTVWSPCVGPTLGAASLLAAQGRDLGSVALTMASFGLGAATPLLTLGSLSRARLVGLRARLGAAGQGVKAAFGVVLALVGILVFSGWDKAVEATVLSNAPNWLIALTTRF